MPKKLSYKYVFDTFAKEGYKLLSKEYINSQEKVEFLCPNGHHHSIRFDSFLNDNQRCAICSKRKKYTLQEVKDVFKKEGWTVLSTKYKDNKQPLDVLCRNNHKLTINLNNFLNGWRCTECYGKRYLNLEIVKKELENEEYKLISNKYINSYTKLDVICPQGHKISFSYLHFYSGERCGQCFGTHKHSLNEVKFVFEKEKYVLLSKRYKNMGSPLKVKCDKGHITNTMSLLNFIGGARCKKCHLKYNRGENHPSWNSELTDEDRREHSNRKKKYKKWVLDVFKNNNFTCQCCGDNSGGNLVNHHLEGWHWCKELRFEISNGVTLCRDCHNKFHKKFGLGWNTSEQFYQFLRGGYNASIKT